LPPVEQEFAVALNRLQPGVWMELRGRTVVLPPAFVEAVKELNWRQVQVSLERAGAGMEFDPVYLPVEQELRDAKDKAGLNRWKMKGLLIPSWLEEVWKLQGMEGEAPECFVSRAECFAAPLEKRFGNRLRGPGVSRRLLRVKQKAILTGCGPVCPPGCVLS
jgi:hypothetical protein